MRPFYFLFGFNFLLLFSFIGEAKINGTAKPKGGNKVYIVYMGKTSFADGVPRNDHAQLLDELKKRKKVDSVLHTYNKSFLGFAARLSDEEAESIAQRPGVVSVFPDKISQLHTTRSWDFLATLTPDHFLINGSTIPPVSKFTSTGADTIIGIIDTGIWPEHLSFSDKCMGPIPKRWKGICMCGTNSTYSFKCNKKVIGARYYDDPDEPGVITSPRDEYGHGTHVASIAAGKPVWGASYKGLAKGTARGGSPNSRIAAYRVCAADGGCVYSNILKAFDDAIADGVDVVSVSLGLPYPDLLSDPISIGAFHAMEKGINVVAGAGNEGPSPGTVINVAPWVLTVGSTTIDREIETIIVLGGNKKIKAGLGMTFSGLNKSPVYQLIDGRLAGSNLRNASNCIPGSLDGAKVKGKIVLCEDKNDTIPTFLVDKIHALVNQGAVGIIMIDNNLKEYNFDYDTTPFAAVGEEDGVQLRSYINSTRNPLATILPTVTVINQKPAPVGAHYSSRGPTPGIKDLLKPDVAAPGVHILAASPPFSDTGAETIEPHLFELRAGTSMACPHVSGLAALVKSQHLTWSHSAIKSAIMTTATNTNNLYAQITTYNGLRATPYDIGAGEISLSGPFSPGLIYDTKDADYIQFLCNMGYNTSLIKSISSTVPSNFNCPCNSSPDFISDMNYPSIAISGIEVNGSRTVTRTVTNVGEVYSNYTAILEAPAGMQVQVVPKILRFTNTVTKLSFQVTFTLASTAQDTWFGSIIWSNQIHKVRSPFAVSNA